MPGKSSFYPFLLFLLLAILGFVGSLISGSVDLSWGELLRVLLGGGDEITRGLVLELRLPRALAALGVGGLLGIAGVLMQVLLRNPLADPYVLGISGGAACAALLAMMLGLGSVSVDVAALIGALVSIFIVFGLSCGMGSWTPARLLLTGVVMASGWGAAISFLLAMSSETDLRGMVFWLMGDLSNTSSPWPVLISLVIGLSISWPLGRTLNLLIRGEMHAASLGVPVATLRMGLFFTASLLTALAVTTAGSIGFIGLVTPHLIRLAGWSDHRLLLPASALFGGTLLMVADTLARTALAPRQLPVGVVTALLGVPLFLYLLRRGKA
uniref:Iron complex transport system permease protein n=1 Tax=Candidatus Kentrum sp. LPFa TaxID=2126335 RepID=A0A450W989_9GAMM|nr:MAG: iron complex transport system permease protein [Candidatus Kentron sp. LPFa]VFK29541.1 MAG: iron complex transport system permease protein [Candidatus Kentron sp. LPFa]